MSALSVPDSVVETKATSTSEEQPNSVDEEIVVTETGMHVPKVNLSVLLVSNHDKISQDEAAPYHYTALTTQVIIQHQQSYFATANECIRPIHRFNTGSPIAYDDLKDTSKKGCNLSNALLTYEQQSSFSHSKDMPSSVAAEPDLEQYTYAHTRYRHAQEFGQWFETACYDMSYIGAQFNVDSEVVVKTETL